MTTTAATPSAPVEPPDQLLPHRIWHYPAAPRSASDARRHVTTQLHHWGLDSLTDTAALVTSELVTNALAASQHARHSGDDDLTSRIAMRLTYSPQDLIVEVWDAGTGRPTRRAAGPDAEDGRGLHLVTALSGHSGHYQARVRTAAGYRPKGKVTWASLPHTTPSAQVPRDTAAGDLPRRATSPGLTETAQDPVVFDLALLQRVRDGLRNLDDGTHLRTSSHPHRPGAGGTA
ncbi:Anti-sigma regulatory factor (Ser/Thr protein kinase) [Parafrankia irregularis]|uniref:Anti-sigma regulatory factor (Ser/Thr protein kinase) n=1 Tax=Parafrankia irregularis TaxID=795642 RepID=A0A0S4QLT5_9ACTN|nr:MULTISPECIES: ATP-binding protein [Parafrankia]MBE3200241.1 ATP-binding protein [Parafrankia sp. CH37]CUU56561.1 Anti-sigma regulatory factor (Ser/Thr protein kinase) [Parafrankia irregularis]